MITIINYDAGNIKSIQNIIKKVGGQCIISSNIDEIKKASKLILPGVGSFDHGVKKLHELNLFDIIKDKANNNTPLLGICLGAQLLGNNSEEGTTEGLGLINMEVIKFKKSKLGNHKIPHMGWSIPNFIKETPISKNLDINSRFYFVHSYHFQCHNQLDILAKAYYGYEFPCAISKGNIFGLQFHPEKSHKYGMQIIKNFIQL
ncbi:imidazole glycerol phosphate synthase subunit HisH [Flammeovirga agarivorans]|uniref:Imidazole glycerol phosphate synthase subunit HisH n=1 Tax=Flammeovirga agarivorans TaxID=2726742 RepID=A0A7X8SHX0_9BACT|nr:imidazole glycerol phosphate synthase subunit HisH [Flammeovirga agarivorans]NLR90509.1 imidazole glycerol phosphate synthase subunit HisH [Flammeovirga agarivorans]